MVRRFNVSLVSLRNKHQKKIPFIHKSESQLIWLPRIIKLSHLRQPIFIHLWNPLSLTHQFKSKRYQNTIAKAPKIIHPIPSEKTVISFIIMFTLSEFNIYLAHPVPRIKRLNREYLETSGRTSELIIFTEENLLEKLRLETALEYLSVPGSVHHFRLYLK